MTRFTRKIPLGFTAGAAEGVTDTPELGAVALVSLFSTLAVLSLLF